MIDSIYDMLKTLIYSELPKGASGKPVLYNQPITGWYMGNRSIISETPGILFQGQPSSQKNATFGGKELTHQILISCWIRADHNDLAEKQALELTRMVYEILLRHKRMWIMLPCPICLKHTLSPIHFISSHSDIFGNINDNYDPTNVSNDTYIKKAKYNFNLSWKQTHSNNLNDFVDSGVATEAFYLMWEDVANNISVPNLSNEAKANILSYQAKKRMPIQLGYDCELSDNIKPVEENNDKALFRGGELLLTIKEYRKISDFGPDDVMTGTW